MEDKLITLNIGKRYGMSCAGMRLSEKFHSPQEQNPTTGRVSRRSTCKRSYAERISNCAGSKPMADVKSGGSSRVQKLVDIYSQQIKQGVSFGKGNNLPLCHKSIVAGTLPTSSEQKQDVRLDKPVGSMANRLRKVASQ